MLKRKRGLLLPQGKFHVKTHSRLSCPIQQITDEQLPPSEGVGGEIHGVFVCMCTVSVAGCATHLIYWLDKISQSDALTHTHPFAEV